MSSSSVRWFAIVIFVASVPGMIVASANDVTGAAISFGLVATVAAVVLIAVTAVITGRIPPDVGGPVAPHGHDEAEAEALEERIRELVATGTDEDALRDLVRAARLLRRRAPV
ncbi:MAG: hypothetical protein WKF43_08085 [Acidimicrobiales bacterium]